MHGVGFELTHPVTDGIEEEKLYYLEPMHPVTDGIKEENLYFLMHGVGFKPTQPVTDSGSFVNADLSPPPWITRATKYADPYHV